jgi:hypothetical protein
MTPDRREFLGRAAIGAATLTGLAALPAHVASALGVATLDEPVDTSWTRRIRGKYRAVFDVPEIESAFGVWRSQLWTNQVRGAFKARPDDIATVVVLRHNGISLAMQQAYWDTYGVGKATGTKHPMTQETTDRNPALLSAARGEVPEQFDAFALDKCIARGTVVLACNVAMEFDVVPRIAKQDGVKVEEARTRARALLLPGVIMQPSGVFAAVAAQDAGCRYVRAS